MNRSATVWFGMAGLALALAACAQPNGVPYPAPPPESASPASVSLAGPANPALARIYFYRESNDSLHPEWTAVWLNGAKVGDSAPGTYFYRDVRPGTYTVSVSSDVPFAAPSRTATLTSDSTSFVRIYAIEGYGISNAIGASGGRRGGAASSAAIPNVFGGSFVSPRVARREMSRLTPGG